jgi:phage-related protein
MADIGIKLGIDGEREFKQTLAEMNSAFKVLKSEMAAVSSEFGKNDKSLESAASKNKVLNKEIDAQKDKIETLKDALHNSAQSFGENDKRTQSWATKLNYAQADLNKMEHELDENNKVLESNGENLDENTKSLGEFGESADIAGKKTLTLGDIIKANLITEAIISGIKMLGEAFKAVGNYIKTAVSGAAQYGDEILSISTKTGVSTKSLQEFSAISELVDVDLNTFTSSLSKNTRSIASAQTGSGEAARAYKQLGISIKDSDGNLRSSEEVFWEVIDSLGKMSNETERDAAAMKLFGKSAQELNPLIAKGSAGVAELTKNAYKMGAVLSEDTLKTLGNLDNQMKIWEGTLKSTSNLIGSAFAPALTGIIEPLNETGSAFNRLISEITNGGSAEEAINSFVSSIQGIIPRILDMVPKLLEIGGSLLGGLAKGILQALPDIIGTATDIIMTLANSLINGLPQILKASIQIIAVIAQGVSKSIPKLVPAIVEAVVSMADTLIDNFDLLLDGAMKLLLALVEAIPPTIKALIIRLPDIINTIVKALIDNFDLLLNASIKLFYALIDAIPKIIIVLVENLPKIVTAAAAALLKPENLKKLLEAAVKLFTAIVTAIPQIASMLTSKMPEVISGIVRGLSEGFSRISSVGKQLVEGLWNGINGMINWIKDKVRGFANSVTGWLKSFFGISSPSKLFRDQIGKNLALGLGEGFADEMKEVSREMQEAVPTDFDASINPIGFGNSFGNGFGVTNGLAGSNLNGASGGIGNGNGNGFGYGNDFGNGSDAGYGNIGVNDSLVLALQNALSGMAFKIDGDKIGELVVSTVERVVYS